MCFLSWLVPLTHPFSLFLLLFFSELSDYFLKFSFSKKYSPPGPFFATPNQVHRTFSIDFAFFFLPLTNLTPFLTGNIVGSKYIHGSVGSVLGAFAVSCLGTLYTQFCGGYAFAVMVPGVLLLVPVGFQIQPPSQSSLTPFLQSGLTAVGGLAQNYNNASTDQFASGLNTGLAMIQLSIALTVGLSLAAAGLNPVVAVSEKVTGSKSKNPEMDSVAF